MEPEGTAWRKRRFPLGGRRAAQKGKESESERERERERESALTSQGTSDECGQWMGCPDGQGCSCLCHHSWKLLPLGYMLSPF
jgi:hypothetical protein